MDLYGMLTNISNVDIEKEIKNAIAKIKNEYSNLTIYRTCFLYSSFIHSELLKRHILSRIVSTKDFDIEYEHRFVLVPNKDDSYFLIDLTYKQFFTEEPDYFKDLISNGYQIVDNNDIEIYMDFIKYATSNKYINK